MVEKESLLAMAMGSVQPLKVNIDRFYPKEELPKEKFEFLKKLESLRTPCFVYFEDEFERNLNELKSFPVPYGLTVRYAMKANSLGGILAYVNKNGGHIDSSSVNEVERARKADIPGERIRLTSQEVPTPDKIKELLAMGVKYTACSIQQLINYGKANPGGSVAVRFNLKGSGWTPATSTGGRNASFGIMDEDDEDEDYGIEVIEENQVDPILRMYKLIIDTLHFHVGSGADPEVQKQAVKKAIKYLKRYPTITTINTGGGIKYGRMSYEKSTDIQDLGRATAEILEQFYKDTGRKIHVEIEPGTRVVASTGYLLGEVIDVVTTGKRGYNFIKADFGMTENARISMYGAQHPIIIIPQDDNPRGDKEYVAMGSCCESGDILTPRPGLPETVDTRMYTEAKRGDKIIMAGVGAYCRSMSGPNYNSHLAPCSWLVRKNEILEPIEVPQTMDQLIQNERIPDDFR
jgi:diaminopimelate decarboxylase